MSGRFVRASKYRHVFGQASKKELCYDNLKVSKNAWDSNLIKANSKFLSVNWESSGGGAFAVVPLEEIGKAPDIVPLFRGHTSAVLDTDFNPFNDRVIASSSDDGKIGIWEIPEDYSFHNYTNSEGEAKDISPVKKLSGHLRKVGHIKFHPLVENLLVSSSNDYTVKLWDIVTGKAILTLQHKDLVTSFAFSYDGNKLATTCRDKKIRIWDLRTGELLQEGPGHAGAKNVRCVWLGTADRIATTGFSRYSDRQIGIWNSEDIAAGPIKGFLDIDSSAGILMPFFDDCTNMLFVAGKGDGNIRYFEFTPKDDELYEVSAYQSTDPQRGFAVAPKRAVNVKENEILRSYKTVKDTLIEPISFIVPRRAEMFQFDLYPDAPAGIPALSMDEWIAGKKVLGPIVFNMESLYDSDVPAEFKTSEGKDAPEVKAPENENPKVVTSLKVEPKVEPKVESKVEPKSPVVAPSPKPVSAPKASIDDLLAKKEVSDLLSKSKALDGHNDIDPPSDNEDKDGEFASQYKEEEATRTKSSTAILSPTLPKPTLPQSERKEPVVDKKPEPIAEKKAEPVVIEKKIESSTESKPAATKGGATLKATVEKLASLVEKLEEQINVLQASNESKDVKLESLEKKVNSLLKK